MKELRFLLRRTFVVGAVMALSTLALAPAGAGASPGPAAIDTVVQVEQPTGDIGVSHVGQIDFAGFGCTYHGRSGPAVSGGEFAVTAISSGSGCRLAMVRARFCRSGSCYTTPWVKGGVAEVWGSSGYQVRWSEHKCDGCSLTRRIEHNHSH